MGQGMSEDKESKRGNGPRDGNPRIHGSAVTRNAMLGRFTELKERVQFLDSTLGDYSYIEAYPNGGRRNTPPLLRSSLTVLNGSSRRVLA